LGAAIVAAVLVDGAAAAAEVSSAIAACLAEEPTS
jgi:hypothetical protein